MAEPREDDGVADETPELSDAAGAQAPSDADNSAEVTASDTAATDTAATDTAPAAPAKKAAPRAETSAVTTRVPELGVPVIGRATARFVRMSPTKVRRVIDLVRGMPATEASAIVKFDPHAAAEPVGKVLASAVANAENLAHNRNERLDPDDLVITEAFVDEGPTMRRFRPRAQGRAYRIRKRSSHITIVVTPAHPETPSSGRAAIGRRAR